MSRRSSSSASAVAPPPPPQPEYDLQVLWLLMLATTLAGALLATFVLEGV